MTGILCAFACLLLTAINDFIFKLFSRKERSKGLFVFLIGVVWMLTLLRLPHAPTTHWGATIFWGIVSGIFSVSANLLLMEGMSRQSAGLCSLIYRLNLVPVVLGAALFLHETPTPLQYLGLAAAIAAILLFQGTATPSKYALGGILLVVGAAFLRAGMGLSYKYAFLNGADKNAVAQINGIFWILGGLVYAALRERKFFKMDRKLIGYSILSGILVAGIVLFMAWSLAYGEAIVVLPIAQMSFILTFILGAVFLKEPFARRQLWALLFGVAGIVLLTL